MQDFVYINKISLVYYSYPLIFFTSEKVFSYINMGYETEIVICKFYVKYSHKKLVNK